VEIFVYQKSYKFSFSYWASLSYNMGKKSIFIKGEKCFVEWSDETTLVEGDASKINFPQAFAQPSCKVR